MRILQLCNKPPYPPLDGGSKAMHNITQGLLDAGHQVKVLCISTAKHPLKVASIPDEYRERTRIEGVFVDTSLNVVDAFTDLVTADNYNISRFFSPDMDIRLIQLLSQEEFDIIHLESLFVTPYIPTLRRYSKARIVLRSHNLEHVIQERIAKGERNILKKPYRKFLARQLKEYEREVLKQVDGVAAITDADAQHMREHGCETPIITVPFGIDPGDYEAPMPPGRPIFFHLGSMDWMPNEEGIRWLLRTVWPRVIKKHPEAKLHLAGNRMPKDMIRARLPGTTVVGRVPDANRYIAQRHVMLVPLFSAGGMRVKIIEGMAMGKCIISTTIGAEGIDHTPGKNILIADTAAAFTDQIDKVLAEPQLADAIGKEAWKLVRARHTNSDIIKELVAFYASLAKT
ncbi:MAG: glycosyltransferase [Flavobacteriales bacterium]|jgi:glycosyltransferase involved in cell wall biosynthesis|nr:glycosyltransferase [Flavobacteriales bacterium]MBK6891636.1 glycosyltransferase [Flavobacteriales bacterium]MBK7247562.1 glycosyltransferase [Flavobacteriales bacterium]MBK9596925.1 glycosyltransferase [Flavobacteriales bacterium]QQS72848.1 MAG: glycosyltransferase [Flavobacteriales bacterium]